MEQRPALEHEALVLRAVDLGAGEIRGQQVGGELHAVEAALDTCAERLDGGRLGQPRRALDQQVTIGQQRHQQPLDQRPLTDDAGLEFGAQTREHAMQAVVGGAVGGGVR